MSTFLINFKKAFAPAIEAGSKRQTIRRHRTDGKRMQVGDTLKLYTGLRTRGARLLREATVASCSSIRIDLDAEEVVIDGGKLSLAARTEFAQLDGFAHWPAMREWFKEQYSAGMFEGYCVRWSA